MKAKRNPLKLSVIASLDGSQSFDLNKNVILDFSNPIKSIPKTNGTQIKMDSSKIAGAEIEFVIFNNFRTTVNTIISDSVTKNSSWKENTNYQLYIPAARSDLIISIVGSKDVKHVFLLAFETTLKSSVFPLLVLQ